MFDSIKKGIKSAYKKGKKAVTNLGKRIFGGSSSSGGSSTHRSSSGSTHGGSSGTTHGGSSGSFGRNSYVSRSPRYSGPAARSYSANTVTNQARPLSWLHLSGSLSRLHRTCCSPQPTAPFFLCCTPRPDRRRPGLHQAQHRYFLRTVHLSPMYCVVFLQRWHRWYLQRQDPVPLIPFLQGPHLWPKPQF